MVSLLFRSKSGKDTIESISPLFTFIKIAAPPLASKIFQVEGVVAVFLGTDFITVTKSEEMDWDHIKSAILGSIMEHYQSGEPAMTEEATGSGHATHSGEDSGIIVQIKDLLDTRVRPAVAQDGGDIVFHGFESGIVYLHMQGACAGCPSSTLTLKMGIENLLRHYIPEVLEVRPVSYTHLTLPTIYSV